MASFTEINAITISLILILSFTLPASTSAQQQCDSASTGGCHDKAKSLLAFASGVNIGRRGYMHVLPDSFYDLMLYSTSRDGFFHDEFLQEAWYLIRRVGVDGRESENNGERGLGNVEKWCVCSWLDNCDGFNGGDNDKDSMLLRNRVVAQVLEIGIVVHSVANWFINRVPLTIRARSGRHRLLFPLLPSTL
ncbi:LOW QUALITY PROTEIN: hypothetical protein NC652_025803 [Populus alba x Populus x berolinensis]|nr:LOW QUALITY PROTEIN: hypothetical protein NC652_025803 [Populus alba x Populus x berolinensis]